MSERLPIVYKPSISSQFNKWPCMNLMLQSKAFFKRRTSNDEIGEFMLRDRSAPPVYKLSKYLIQNSMLDVRRSSLKPPVLLLLGD